MYAHVKTSGFSYLRLSLTLVSVTLKEKGDSLNSLAPIQLRIEKLAEYSPRDIIVKARDYRFIRTTHSLLLNLVPVDAHWHLTIRRTYIQDLE